MWNSAHEAEKSSPHSPAPPAAARKRSTEGCNSNRSRTVSGWSNPLADTDIQAGPTAGYRPATGSSCSSATQTTEIRDELVSIYRPVRLKQNNKKRRENNHKTTGKRSYNRLDVRLDGYINCSIWCAAYLWADTSMKTATVRRTRSNIKA